MLTSAIFNLAPYLGSVVPLVPAAAAHPVEPVPLRSTYSRNGDEKNQVDPVVVDVADLRAPYAERMFGVCNWGGVESVLDMYNTTGAQNGLYRLKIYTHHPSPAEYPGIHMMTAKAKGHRVLLTTKGTPWDMATDLRWEDHLGNEYPPYARSMPRDPQEYADYVEQLLEEIEADYNVLPDYLEIWAEPDRPEHWSGTREDYLELYRVVSTTLRNSSNPNIAAIKLGGAGVAYSLSAMEGEEPILWDLVKAANNYDLPLEFISWHHYTVGAEIRYNDVSGQLRELFGTLGMSGIELFVTEWNIYPNALNNPNSMEFDESHAAANLAAFMAVASEKELDGSTFFQLHDIDLQGGIGDLMGRSVGAITRRGVKKPVFRVLESMYGSAWEQRVNVDHNPDDFALNVYGTRAMDTQTNRDRVRLVVANDSVEPDWLWSSLVRDRLGMKPGKTWEQLEDAGYVYTRYTPTVAELMAEGMAEWQAEGVLEILPAVELANAWLKVPRTARVQLYNLSANPQVFSVTRFDSNNNTPAQRREELLPLLELAEFMAHETTRSECNAILVANGYAPFEDDIPHWRNPEHVAYDLEIPVELATELWVTYFKVLHDERLSQAEMLNMQPATTVQRETAEEAGVALDEGGLLAFEMEPNSVYIIDINL